MISYQTEGARMPDIKRRETTAWIKAVAAMYGRKIGDIGYLFCNDEKILEVNREYLAHDYFTDIITFDYCEGTTLNGDLVISLDTVRSNAELSHKTYDEELHRHSPPLRPPRQSPRRARADGSRRKPRAGVAKTLTHKKPPASLRLVAFR